MAKRTKTFGPIKKKTHCINDILYSILEYSGSEGVNDHNSEEVIELVKEDPANEIMIDLPNDVNTSRAKSVDCDEVVIGDDMENDVDLVEITDSSNPTDQIFNTFTKAGVIKAPTFCAICRNSVKNSFLLSLF